MDTKTLLAANAAYYRAFAEGDVAAMNRLWAEDDVSCVHPGWPALLGRQPVLDSYRNILGNSQQERVEYRDDVAIFGTAEGRVHCIEFVGGSALAATNWFRLFGDEWRMIHHQASPIAVLVSRESPPTSTRLN
jgi:ketosteroid isomerase-like protein